MSQSNGEQVRQAAERRRMHLQVLRERRSPIESPYTYYEPSTGAAGMCDEAEIRDAAILANAYLELYDQVNRAFGKYVMEGSDS